jgi:hypothetical protein
LVGGRLRLGVGRRMILIIVLGVAGLWLAGNHHPAGWGLAAAAHLLWLPWALASRQYGFAVTVAALGLVALRNYRRLRPAHFRHVRPLRNRRR